MGFGFHMLEVSPMQPSVGSAVPALSVVQISFPFSPVLPSALAAMLKEKSEDKEGMHTSSLPTSEAPGE